MISESIRLTRRYRPSRRTRRGAAVLAVLYSIFAVFLVGMALSPTDAFVYELAGERLNAGHFAYSIVAGDYPVGLNPPYWNVPLLSPPLIAVIWRPLALLGTTGLLIGWLAAGMAFLLAIAYLVWRNPLVAGIAVVVLTVPIGWQLGLGNLNGFLLPGLVAMWTMRRRQAVTGGILAAMVALKVVPFVLLWWLITQRAWKAVGAFVVVSAALLVVVAVGAGPQSLLDYLDVVRHTTTEGSNPLSLAGLARSAGLDPSLAALIPWGVVAVAAGLVWLFRARPDVAFSISVASMIFGSPVIVIYWYAMLLAALAPYPAPFPAAEPIDEDDVRDTLPTSRPTTGPEARLAS